MTGQYDERYWQQGSLNQYYWANSATNLSSFSILVRGRRCGAKNSHFPLLPIHLVPHEADQTCPVKATATKTNKICKSVKEGVDEWMNAPNLHFWAHDDAKALKIENYTESKKICKIEILYILTGRKECGVKVYTSRTERLSCRVVLQVPPLKFTNTQCWSSRHLPKHLSVITVPLLLTKELNTLRGVTKKNTLCLEWCLGVQFMICCHIMSLILRSN